MPWLRLDDVDYDDALVRAVGNAAYGALVRIKLYCSAQRTDGWIDRTKARELATGAELRRLTDTRLGQRPPLLHRAGDDCRCMAEQTPPAAEGWLYVHAFLDRNPSRSENDVHRAKRRELRDPVLKAAVRERDGDACRYCGSTVRWRDRRTPLGGVFDHVDPRLAAGADNLVVACRGCNGRKKDCTPAQAGMELLPPPPPPAGSVTHLRPDLRQIYDGSETDPDPDLKRTQNPSQNPPGPEPVPATAADPVEHPGSRQVTPTSTPNYDDTCVPMTDGTGRGRDGLGSTQKTLPVALAGDAGPTGHRPTVGPPTTPRNNLAPSPYAKAVTSYRPPIGGPS